MSHSASMAIEINYSIFLFIGGVSCMNRLSIDLTTIFSSTGVTGPPITNGGAKILTLSISKLHTNLFGEHNE